jgi:hypothetical protein
VIPIPPALLNELQKTADALKTAYFRIVSFAVDNTTLYTSVSRPTGTASSPSGGGVGPGDGDSGDTGLDFTISAAK